MGKKSLHQVRRQRLGWRPHEGYRDTDESERRGFHGLFRNADDVKLNKTMAELGALQRRPLLTVCKKKNDIRRCVRQLSPTSASARLKKRKKKCCRHRAIRRRFLPFYSRKKHFSSNTHDSYVRNLNNHIYPISEIGS